MNQFLTVDLPAVATVAPFLWRGIMKARKLATQRHDQLLAAVKQLDEKVEKINSRVMGLELRARKGTRTW